jgi:hypothetical protein
MKQICVLSIVFALGATPVFADQGPQHLRKCELVEAKDGRDVCAYTLEDWKHALKVDRLVTRQERVLELQKKKIEFLESQKSDFQAQLKALSDNERILIDHNNKLTNDLIKLDKKYQEERVKPRWGTTFSWGAAAAAVAVLGGYIARDLIRD